MYHQNTPKKNRGADTLIKKFSFSKKKSFQISPQPNHQEIIWKSGFTLVELIIVLSILALLSTIAFLSFSGYIRDSRDVSRISELKIISQQLDLYKVKNAFYPEIINKTTITYSWNILWYQWDLDESLSKNIGLNKTPLDPYDKKTYTYYLTKDGKEFQLLWFLEKEKLFSVLPQVYASNAKRYPYTAWKPLWVLTDSDNTPIQNLSLPWNSLDIYTTNSPYKAILDPNSSTWVIVWTWGVLKTSSYNYSCKRLFETKLDTSWDAMISPYWKDTKVYCSVSNKDKNFYSEVVNWDFESEVVNINRLYAWNTNDISIFNESWNNVMKVIGNVQFTLNNFIPVDPNKKYTLSWKFKAIWTFNSKLYFWFVEYDENFREIIPGVVNISNTGTYGELYEDIHPNDAIIKIKKLPWTLSCADWKTKATTIEFTNSNKLFFNTDNSWNYNDLPNFNFTTWKWFSDCIDKGSYCELVFTGAHKAWVSYPSGTPVRMHWASWGSYNYIAASWKIMIIDTKYTLINWTVQWMSLYWVWYSQFRHGTKYIQPLILANYQQDINSILLIDDIQVTIE